MSRKRNRANATDALQTVKGAGEAIAERGRKARKAAKAEAERQAKLARKATHKVTKRANKKALRRSKPRLVEQASLANERAAILANATAERVQHKKVKRSKRRKRLAVLAILGGAAVAVRKAVSGDPAPAPPTSPPPTSPPPRPATSPAPSAVAQPVTPRADVDGAAEHAKDGRTE